MGGRAITAFVIAALAFCACGEDVLPPMLCTAAGSGPTLTLALEGGWALRSSSDVGDDGAAIARAGLDTGAWVKTSVPSTVVAALVAAGELPDPFFGMNLRAFPGMDYPVGEGFSDFPMSAASPFRAPWWFRTEFTLPPTVDGKRVWLHLGGVNYRAEVWMNGRRIADEDAVQGTFRDFDLDVTDAVSTCAPNALALRVRAPTPDELAWNWVDWNPFPPDKDMGVWRPVVVRTTGPVRLAAPNVITKTLDLPSLAQASLAVSVEATNATDAQVPASITAQIESHALSVDVVLAPRETRVVRVGSVEIDAPRVWWPTGMGDHPLYTVEIAATIAGEISDTATARFGVRTGTSELTDESFRLFRVNGRPVLVRGAGWAPDMLLREPDARIDTELDLVENMGLNAIRLEGKLGFDRLFDDADERGILVVAGWCCCDIWERQGDWGAGQHAIALASLASQAKRLRTHPSVLVWLEGSDDTPPPDLEQAYTDTLAALDWPNPVLASANSTLTPVLGTAGLKMPGPYMWVPPSYWSTDTGRGGAFGFDTETSAGAAIPPVESLRKFLPAEHLWPIDEQWVFHGGTSTFADLSWYTNALAGRMGAPTSIDDFSSKSQLMAYEGVRAMFEAYGRNKYHATGVIQWMLDNAWPGILWHLYDYYWKPGGGYFGAQKALEPLHIQYGYDDRMVVVVSGLQSAQKGLVARAEIRAPGGDLRWSGAATVDVPADGVVAALAVPEPAGLPPAYLVELRLTDANSAILSDNTYWLSTTPDVLDWDNGTWYVTPTSQYADLTSLGAMPAQAITASAQRATDGDDEVVTVTLGSAGPRPAFFVRAEIAAAPDGDEVLPVRWSGNYVTLEAGERRTLTARYKLSDKMGRSSVLRVAGWNVAKTLAPLGD